MSGAGFGRKGAAPDTDLAARRASFLAAERARAPVAQAEPDHGWRAPSPAGLPHGSPKKAGTAYLLWFFLGGFSAHRFYLGFPASGIVQLLLTPLGYAMLMSKSPSGFALTGVAALWILADAFLIPNMVRKANERYRTSSYASTFA